MDEKDQKYDNKNATPLHLENQKLPKVTENSAEKYVDTFDARSPFRQASSI